MSALDGQTDREIIGEKRLVREGGGVITKPIFSKWIFQTTIIGTSLQHLRFKSVSFIENQTSSILVSDGKNL